MPENARLTRKQTQLLEALLLGQTIVAASTAIGINEKTARLWLKQSHVIAERERLEAELRQSEEAEITKIMTTGYAAIHKRVEALNEFAGIVRKSFDDPATGEVNPKWLIPDKIREYRGLLDDIAKETGGRKIKQEVDHNIMVDLLNSEHVALLADLAMLPDVSQKPTEDTATAADPA